MPDPMNFHPASPILRVRDLAASLDWYVRVLGFSVDWQDPGIIGSVSRGRCNLMLCEGDQGQPGTWAWIGVGDVERLHDEFRGTGATIRNPPTNYPWAREMQVVDPDGHVLRFGSEPKADQPFGPWLDMHGVRWMKKADGGWARSEH